MNERLHITVQQRVAGAVLGAAIGDAVGAPVEFVNSFEEIKRRWPPNGVTGFVELKENDGRNYAPTTDDSELAEVVLRGVIDAFKNQWGLDETMSSIATGVAAWGLTHDPAKAPGRSCLAGAAALRAGAHWSVAGGATAGGCGSVMRAYPFGLAFGPGRAVEWSVEHSKMTHRDPIALAACAGMAAGMVEAMGGQDVPAIVGAMIYAAAKEDVGTAEMMARAAGEAQAGIPVDVTLQRLEGWAAHEAIAAAIYITIRHPDDVIAGVLEAANTPGDSDSIATLVGALLGARHGVAAFPHTWVTAVERSAELMSLANTLTRWLRAS